jgi:lipopolysaccharide transport system permease protein
MISSQIDKAEFWTMEISPKSGWLDLNLREIWRYRDLLRFFMHRDFVANYKQAVLGPFWFILNPLLNTIVYTIIFGLIIRVPTDGLPPILFFMSGIIIWNYFSACVLNTSNTFLAHAHIFGKIYFPRLIIPISTVIINLLTFAIQFGVYICFIIYFAFQGVPIHPNIFILLLPLLLIQIAAFGLGTGLIVSSLTTKYRDLAYAMGFGIQLWMYATPIFFPLSLIPEKWQWIFAVNPMTSIVETFRYILLGNGYFQPWILSLGAVTTLITLIIGLVLFTHIEKTVIDTI